MSQLSLYLDDATMEILQEQAKESGLSLSKCAVQDIRESRQVRGWPVGFFDLYGCIKDDNTFVRPDQGDSALDNDPASFFAGV